MSSSALRSPSTEISTCSPASGPPNRNAARRCRAARPGTRSRRRPGTCACTDDAAARAERRALDARQLRRGLRHAVVASRSAAASGSPIASAVTLARGAQVAFHQRRRERLRVGDVVEAVADGVGRQQRRRRRCRAPSRSLTARAYSARFRRWNGREPGIGIDARRRDRCASRAPRPARRAVGRSGRRAPGGGIMPARSLRIIFSVIGDVLAPPSARRTPRATARRPCRDRCGSRRSTASPARSADPAESVVGAGDAGAEQRHCDESSGFHRANEYTDDGETALSIILGSEYELSQSWTGDAASRHVLSPIRARFLLSESEAA